MPQGALLSVDVHERSLDRIRRPTVQKLTLCGRGLAGGAPLKASQIDSLIGFGLPSFTVINVTDILRSNLQLACRDFYAGS